MTMRQFFLWPVLALCLFTAACSNGNDDVLQGWIEGDFIFVSPDEQGRIETLLVRQGDQVKTGQLMFTLDQDLQAADLGVAEATLANAKQAFERAQQLMKSGSGTQKDFDVAQALYREAQAKLSSAQTRLTRRKVLSPVEGLIQTVYFRPGETVPPGRPIVSILPPGNVKVRFYVPEPLLARIAIDDPIKFGCDGCPSDLTGKISFISRYAEYTPPVIYSQQERHKLVYLVEALPANPAALRVGQPVDVTVTPKAPDGKPSESKAPAK